MTTFFSILIYLVGLLAMPFVILYRLPKWILIKLGFMHHVSNEMVSSGLNETTGNHEEVRYSPWYDFQEVHYNCDIRVLLTLGRERVPKNYPKIKGGDFMELTGDVYCLNTTDLEMKVSLARFEINKYPCLPVNPTIDISQEFLIPPGQYVNLPTVITQSIGYSLEETFSFVLFINDERCELDRVAKRMIKT